jgi:beta-carotene hydroxylase
MVRFKEDYRQILFVVIGFLCMLVVYINNAHFETLTLLAISFCLFFVYILPAAVAHNHYHRTIFKNNSLNCFMNYLLFFMGGTTPYTWTLQHNLGHHLNYLNQENDPAPWIKNGDVVSRLKYTVYGTLNIYPYCFKLGVKYPNVFKKFKFHLVICIAILAALILIDPRGTLFAIVIPTTLIMFNLIDSAYEHHTGLNRSCDFNASRTNVNRIRNWLAFNIGYHTAHHVKPGLHWTKLPKYHEEIKHNIPENTIVNTLG